MTRRLVLGALAAMLAAGCGKEPAEPGSSSRSSPVAPASPPATPAMADLTQADLDRIFKSPKPYHLALVVKTRNNPFFDPMIKAAEAKAREAAVSLEVQSPAQETDKEQQFALVQDVTARKVDAILIAPADSKGVVPALKQAQDHGVTVINLDNRVDPTTAASAGLALGAYVGADNEQGGHLAGETMVTHLHDRGKVAILEGIRGADNAEARKRGFTEAVTRRLEIVASESAEWDTQKAYAKFQAMLAAHPDLNGVFCANDKMALGAIKAISEAGKKGQITVVGYDNIPDVKPYLKDGELYATIEQHPDLMGKYGVVMAVGVLTGAIAKGKQFLVPLEVVTSASAPAR